jgi:hypothetical protein
MEQILLEKLRFADQSRNSLFLSNTKVDYRVHKGCRWSLPWNIKMKI